MNFTKMRRARTVDKLLSLGPPARVWPHSNGSHLVFTLAAGRPGAPERVAVCLSHDGTNWEENATFTSDRPRATSTGQPFLSQSNTILVPVWDVGFYTQGSTYFAIYRGKKLGETWELVYEDVDATYANHFFQSSDGSHVCIGVGTGKRPSTKFTPAGGYLLHSRDDGRSWTRVFTYDKACALYDGTVSDTGEYLLAGREQGTVIKGSLSDGSFGEISLGRPSRNMKHIPELQKYVISSDSAILVASDPNEWSVIKMPIPDLCLRYPFYHRGLIYFTATGWASLIVATDLENWYRFSDLSKLTASGFGRMTLFRDHFYCGSEFDGQLVRIPASTRPEKLGRVRQIRYAIRRALGARNTFTKVPVRQH